MQDKHVYQVVEQDGFLGNIAVGYGDDLGQIEVR